MSEGPRIGNVSAVLLTLVAGAVDGIQFLVGLLIDIPLIGLLLVIIGNLVVSVTAMILFGLWLSILGISPIHKYPLSFFGMGTLEQVPLLNNLIPGWTGFMLYIIVQERLTTRG